MAVAVAVIVVVVVVIVVEVLVIEIAVIVVVVVIVGRMVLGGRGIYVNNSSSSDRNQRKLIDGSQLLSLRAPLFLIAVPQLRTPTYTCEDLYITLD